MTRAWMLSTQLAEARMKPDQMMEAEMAEDQLQTRQPTRGRAVTAVC